MIYEYRWQKYVPWKGRRCVVLARGKLNSAKVEFLDNGEWAIVSRNALRKVRPCDIGNAESSPPSSAG